MQLIAPALTNYFFSSTNVPLTDNPLQIITAIQTVYVTINPRQLCDTNIPQNQESFSKHKNAKCLFLDKEFRYRNIHSCPEFKVY